MRGIVRRCAGPYSTPQLLRRETLMVDNVGELSRIAASKLRIILGLRAPGAALIRAVLEKAHLASLKTEEGRFVRGSLTFSDPRHPDMDPPPLTRAQYPGFTPFAHRLPLTSELFAKLSRAIDQWSGSIAIYGTTAANLVVWGIVDQIVHSNMILHRERGSGMSNPGLFTVTVDAVGALSVYHGNVLLAGIEQDQLVRSAHDALRSPAIRRRIAPALMPAAQNIVAALGTRSNPQDVLAMLLDNWSDAIARLCIGLRRLGTGGAFLLSPAPLDHELDVSHRLPYRRLSDAVALGVLDKLYADDVRDRVLDQRVTTIPRTLVDELLLAETDSEDRDLELTGAVRLVTPLAAVDGLVLLTPSLAIVGFGVKIKSSESIGRVYDGAAFSQKGTRARLVDAARFGTRHSSVLRYCRADRRALGVIVSQDGQVRLAASEGRSLTLWENVRLLHYEDNVGAYASWLRRARHDRNSNSGKRRLGYTDMPKTMRALQRLNAANTTRPN